jgi:hypothetical protein
MATQELALGGSRFSAIGLSAAGNDSLAYSDLCALGGGYSIATRNDYWNNAHTSNPSSRGERPGEKPNTLVQRAQCMSGSSNG